MNTLLDVINKYSLSDEIGNVCAKDQYFIRNQSDLKNISSEELNDLKYSTILQMVSHKENAIKILNEWKGSRTHLLYRNIINKSSYMPDVMDIVREDILKSENPVELIKDICENMEVSRIDSLFQFSSGYEDDSFLVKIANRELIKFLIECEMVIDDILLWYSDYMPKSLFDVLYDCIELYIDDENCTEYTFYTSTAFYDYINVDNVYKNHHTFKSLITGKCVALKTNKKVMEFFLEVEKKHPKLDILGFIDGTPYTVFHIYRCYKNFGVKSKKDITYDLLIKLSYFDLIMLRNVFSSDVDKLITKSNFINETEIDTKLIFNIMDAIYGKYGEACNIDVLDKFFENNIEEIINLKDISYFLDITNKYESFIKFAFMYPVEEIIEYINRDKYWDDSTETNTFVVKLLDHVLSVDRENYKKVNFKRLRSISNV